jgi:hypothetical protein
MMGTHGRGATATSDLRRGPSRLPISSGDFTLMRGVLARLGRFKARVAKPKPRSRPQTLEPLPIVKAQSKSTP